MTKDKAKEIVGDAGKVLGEYSERMYKYWIDKHSDKHVIKWCEKYGYKDNLHEDDKFVKYFISKFIDWIDSED